MGTDDTALVQWFVPATCFKIRNVSTYFRSGEIRASTRINVCPQTDAVVISCVRVTSPLPEALTFLETNKLFDRRSEMLYDGSNQGKVKQRNGTLRKQLSCRRFVPSVLPPQLTGSSYVSISMTCTKKALKQLRFSYFIVHITCTCKCVQVSSSNEMSTLQQRDIVIDTCHDVTRCGHSGHNYIHACRSSVTCCCVR